MGRMPACLHVIHSYTHVVMLSKGTNGNTYMQSKGCTGNSKMIWSVDLGFLFVSAWARTLSKGMTHSEGFPTLML